MVYVRDLFDHEGRPLDFHRFVHRFHSDRYSPFRFYFGLIHSIPGSQKLAWFELDDSLNNDDLFEKILRVPHVSQFIYDLQLQRNITEPTAVKKWKGQFVDIETKRLAGFLQHV